MNQNAKDGILIPKWNFNTKKWNFPPTLELRFDLTSTIHLQNTNAVFWYFKSNLQYFRQIFSKNSIPPYRIQRFLIRINSIIIPLKALIDQNFDIQTLFNGF